MSKVIKLMDRVGKVYELTFDEYGYLDTTIGPSGKPLSGSNSVVKSFVANQHRLFGGSTPDGFRRIR